MNKIIKIIVRCYLLVFTISLFLFIFGTTYNPTNVRKVTIYSITDETISYIDSINLDDPIIKTIPKPKFGKYNVEDEIYIDTVKNKVKTFYITPSTTSKIEKIGETSLVLTMLLPVIIMIIAFGVLIIAGTKGLERIGVTLFYFGVIIAVVLLDTKYADIGGYLFLLSSILGSILAIIGGYIRRKR